MRHARARPHESEQGFAIIEVVVSAAVLVIVVMGVLAAMDAVAGTAGANKARTVAATLAEEDQEALRGMRTVSIAGYAKERTVDVGGVEYTIESKAEWIRDATGETVSCTTTEGQVSYLRITSKVTSPVTGAAVKPVVLTSLVAPPAGSLGTQGTLAVSVTNAAGGPVVNLPVTISGTAARSGTTNQEGCVVFSLIPAGTYTVTLEQGGWVDRAGATRSQRPGVTVTAGNVSTVAMEYDRASGLTLQVETKPHAMPVQPDPSSGIIAVNTEIAPSGFLALKPTAASPTINVTGLFPFTSPYTFYSGTCQNNDPSLPEHTPGYFDTFPGSLRLHPGVNGGTMQIREPAINIHVRHGGNDFEHGVDWDTNQSRGWIYPLTVGCTTERIPAGRLAQGGKLAEPGQPFGTYGVCAEDRAGQGRHAKVEVVNGHPDGTSVHDLWIDMSAAGRNGLCPDTWP